MSIGTREKLFDEENTVKESRDVLPLASSLPRVMLTGYITPAKKVRSNLRNIWLFNMDMPP
jgi:hypothetical protein